MGFEGRWRCSGPPSGLLSVEESRAKKTIERVRGEVWTPMMKSLAIDSLDARVPILQSLTVIVIAIFNNSVE